MEMRLDVRTRERLVDRRERLVAARQAPAAPSELGDLLDQVDAALSRFDAGRFGLCETCHEPIEDDRLRVDPLIRFCLDHLDTVEQRALERDLQLASEVQRTLLPKRDIEAFAWDIHYRYDAVGPVSGDYCDVIVPRAADAGVLVAVGDVSGKGVAAVPAQRASERALPDARRRGIVASGHAPTRQPPVLRIDRRVPLRDARARPRLPRRQSWSGRTPRRAPLCCSTTAASKRSPRAAYPSGCSATRPAVRRRIA